MPLLATLRRDLMSSDRKSIYLFYGTEGLLVDRALDSIRSRFAEEADLDFNLTPFDGENASADEIVEVCNTMPFLVDRRLVIVRNADKLSTDDSAKLAAYAANPSPFASLVLVGEKFRKDSKLYKAVVALGPNVGFVKEFAAPKKSEYPAKVREMFAERSRRITPEAAELFVRGVGYDLRRITSEIDKALSFIGEKTVIERADIEDVLSTTAETSVFDFLDALAARDGRQAMRLLAELVGQGESVYGIHAMAVRQVRELVAAQSLAQRGETGSAALAAYLKRQEWQVKRLPTYAKRFTPGEPAELIRAAAETEAEMKTSRDPRLAFERWVLRVCGA